MTTAATVPTLVVVAGLVLTSCVPDRPARLGGGTASRLESSSANAAPEASWAEAGLLAGPCAGAVRTTLAEWGAVGGPMEAPPGPGGERIIRVPTGESGVWVVAAVPAERTRSGVPGATIVLHRVDDTGSRTRRFSAECRASERRTTGGAPGTAGGPFTDADLRAALVIAGGRGLVVYAWSPHMPLSVDGWAEIASAAEARGLLAIPVLIAHADPDFARRQAARAGIPPRGLREVASVELIMRDLQVHAPSILVFRGGRVAPVLPGYRNAEGYGRFLEAFEAGG